jgi:hypothetical protein
MGWLNPFLYAYSANFTNDITVGVNNCTAIWSYNATTNVYGATCCVEGFFAAKGWDPITGLGSVDFAAFKETALNVANMSTMMPTLQPSQAPTTTAMPTFKPTKTPTQQPSVPEPTSRPTAVPTAAPFYFSVDVNYTPLSNGAVAGIIVGVVVGVLCIAVIAFLAFKGLISSICFAKSGSNTSGAAPATTAGTRNPMAKGDHTIDL